MSVLEECFVLGDDTVRIGDSPANIQPVIFREVKGTAAGELGRVLTKALIEADSGYGGQPVCPLGAEEQPLSGRSIGVVESRCVGAEAEFVLVLCRQTRQAVLRFLISRVIPENLPVLHARFSCVLKSTQNPRAPQQDAGLGRGKITRSIGNRHCVVKFSTPQQYVGESAENVGIVRRTLEHTPVLGFSFPPAPLPSQQSSPPATSLEIAWNLCQTL